MKNKQQLIIINIIFKKCIRMSRAKLRAFYIGTSRAPTPTPRVCTFKTTVLPGVETFLFELFVFVYISKSKTNCGGGGGGLCRLVPSIKEI